MRDVSNLFAGDKGNLLPRIPDILYWVKQLHKYDENRISLI